METMAHLLLIIGYSLLVWCRPECGWNSVWRILREHESIVSGNKVNRLIDWFCGDGLPTIAHVDLS